MKKTLYTIFFILVFMAFVEGVPTNTTIRVHSLGMETYGVEKCSIEGQCRYYSAMEYITLDYTQDHLVKIVPKRHYQGIGEDTIKHYLNVRWILHLAGIFGCISIIYWLIGFLTGE